MSTDTDNCIEPASLNDKRMSKHVDGRSHFYMKQLYEEKVEDSKVIADEPTPPALQQLLGNHNDTFFFSYVDVVFLAFFCCIS